MYLFWFAAPAAVCLTVLANLELRPAGWLDRLVQYQKQKFIKDVNDVAPVQIKASIQPRPEGYVDSASWNFSSVSHLLNLIESSPEASEVRGALRRMMRPSRRFMSRPESFKYFPSLSMNVANYFYYNIESHEMYFEEDNSTDSVVDENSVVVISNPVEARLPSAQISVRLLKEILETRAIAARVMPSTTRATMKWIPQESTRAVTGARNDSEVVSNSTSTHGDDHSTTHSGTDGTTHPRAGDTTQANETPTPDAKSKK